MALDFKKAAEAGLDFLVEQVKGKDTKTDTRKDEPTAPKKDPPMQGKMFDFANYKWWNWLLLIGVPLLLIGLLLWSMGGKAKKGYSNMRGRYKNYRKNRRNRRQNRTKRRTY